MHCPHCRSRKINHLHRTTDLGYQKYRCRKCQHHFNERTGTPFNFLEVPTDIVFQVVLWRLRYKLSLRDLSEMFLMRGFIFTHETVRDWEARFAPLLTTDLRTKRKRHAGQSWYVDETYIRVKKKWCYLYRAIDRDGNLVDSMLSERRNMEAAKAFFESAKTVAGCAPQRVTTDGHDAYPRAIAEALRKDVVHRTSRYLNHRMEQDHRGIKQRYYPMQGFGAVYSAQRFCRAYDEVRHHFRARRRMGEVVSLVERRQQFLEQVHGLQTMFQAA
jgi:transposase-like protein